MLLQRPTLKREWFYVPAHAQLAVTRFLKQCFWFRRVTALDRAMKTIHMATWNNKTDSVPGWFFAFEGFNTISYSQADFLDVFAAAKHGILGPCEPGILASCDRDAASGLSLAWGLTIFGMSIQYQPDAHVGVSALERFSSNARFDGLGDCEDIAKEICMAHNDLCALKIENVAEHTELVELQRKANQYVCIIALGTVKRPNQKPLAHAFAMLVPKYFMHKRKKHAGEENLVPMLCDGTYPAYPVNCPAGWSRPWRHVYLVSALIPKVGEIFFRYNRGKTYGIKFEDFFPEIKDGVSFGRTHDRLTMEEKDLVREVLESNLPIQRHTFGFEHQSIVSRFVSLWSEKTGDFARFKEWCKDGINADYFHRQTHSVSQTLFNTLMKATTGHTEMAFSVGADKELLCQTIGQYGCVERAHPEGPSGGHSHHRAHDMPYREFNVPTPEDVMTFISHRTLAILSGDQYPRALEIVVTHERVYELTDLNDASGLVTKLVSRFRADWQHRQVRQDREALLDEIWAATVLAFVELEVYDSNCPKWDKALVSKMLCGKIFSDQQLQDNYINVYARPVGVCIRELPMAQYVQSSRLQAYGAT